MREIFLCLLKGKGKVAVDLKKDKFSSLRVELFSSCPETLSARIALLIYFLKTTIYLLWI